MFPGGGGRCTGERRCKAKQGRHGKTALTYESCLYNSTDFAPRTRGVKDLFGNAHLKVISSVRHLTVRGIRAPSVGEPPRRQFFVPPAILIPPSLERRGRIKPC